MPDLRREGRQRAGQALDVRVQVRLAGEGSRNQYGEFVPSTQTFSVWARRDDLQNALGRDVTIEGDRLTEVTVYVMRWQARIVPGAVIIDGGREFRVDAVEEVGRRRYMAATGVYVQ